MRAVPKGCTEVCSDAGQVYQATPAASCQSPSCTPARATKQHAPSVSVHVVSCLLASDVTQLRIFTPCKMPARWTTALLALLAAAAAAQREAAPAPRQQAPHPTSPCPSVFSYEGRRPDKNRWFGVILVTTEEPLKGIRLDIALDRPAQILGNWEGKVSSKDNIHFTVVNLNKKIAPGPPVSVRIFVKFEEMETIPQVKSIRFNGKQICPSEHDTQLSAARPGHTSLGNPQTDGNYPVVRRTTTARGDAEWVTPQPARTKRPDEVRDPLPWEPPVAKSSTELPLPWDDASRETPRPRVTTAPPAKRQTASPGAATSRPKHRCGVVDVQARPLVTRGQKTARGQWPWHAALYQSKGIDLRYICGGSLISSSIVLTAAHCVTRPTLDTPVDPETLVVYLGKHHLKMWSEGGVQDKQVSAIHVHPAYNSNDFRGDLAVLMLSSAVEFSRFVQPVCLWSALMRDLKAVEGREGTVVGWGYDETGQVTEELMMAKMPVVSEVTCLRSYPQFFSHFATNNTFCAGFQNGTSVCNGDSGGGMVFPTRHDDGTTVWQIRGLVSISVSQESKKICDTSHYVVFTDVAKHLDWIQKYLAN
ncbi:serine protease gd-like [Bacillus rossius redtenbacheri]|uniref:serine protease gd-like n=1 Tax=Bacillus rossius redtenbacheri TaxID=93214 RepID=UPI002FDCED58